ncbi:MAG: DUF368 domain-containing protein [Thermodesulfobacteriota bacterium]
MPAGEKQGRALADYLKLGLKGFCMGAADVVPGVSGGTMAFILGIYEELVQGIKAFDLRVLGLLLRLRIREALSLVPWRFLLVLATGILSAIFTLARLITWLLANRPVFIWSFFFGLILASIITVTRHIEKWRPGHVLAALAAAAAAFLLVGLTPTTTPETYWFLFVSGVIAICAMILPGISGSFILVLLGKYDYVLAAVNNRDFLVLFIFTLGTVTGITLFSRVLSWLLARHHDLTIALLCGLMVGSLRKIWPWKTGIERINVWPRELGSDTLTAVLLIAVGVGLVLALEWAANRGRT